MNKTKNKIIIYQIFARLFGNTNITCLQGGNIENNGCGKMNDLSDKALYEIKKLGITHIWMTGIIEHASKTDYSKYNIPKDHKAVVKGEAGSPYAIKDYYNVDPDLAENVESRMDEFEEMVKRVHNAGLKLIIDFVPNHVSREYHSTSRPKDVADLGENDDVSKAFSPSNNFYYIPNTKLEGVININNDENKENPYVEFPAKATGNDKFDQFPNMYDWYETVKLNYGVDYCNNKTKHFCPIPNTWNKMRDILFFWTSKGVDGFRCDMAEMVPVEFWEYAITQVKNHFPKTIFIAEVYNPGEYRNYLYKGKFDYLYDKVGLYDILRSITCGTESATRITPHWQSLSGIESRMLNFLENHDEQRIASDFFIQNGYKAIPAMIVSACMNTNPVMIYFGQELGESGMDSEGYSGRDGRTTIFDYWTIYSYWLWQIKGRYSERYLTNEQKFLRHFYSTLLNLCNSEKAISKGSFFDLTYANGDSWNYNVHKQFSFFRKYENDLLLFVINFDNIPVRVSVNIPSHAFEFLDIPNNHEFTVKELLSKKEEKIIMAPDKQTTVQLDKFSGKIYKIKI